MIRTYIREGQIVPMEVTVKLLENAMREALEEGREGEGCWEAQSVLCAIAIIIETNYIIYV